MSQQQPTQPTQPDPSAWQQPGYPPAPPAPQPATKSWFARHKIITGLLALVVLGLVIGTMGGGSGQQPSGSPAAQGAAAGDAADPAAKPAAAKVGSAVRDGNFEFTVTKVQPGVASVGTDMFGEKAQGQFVLVHVTVANIGTEPQLLMDSAQTVFDAKGRKFSPDSTSGLYIKDNEVLFTEINPGNTVKGILVFDMPKDASPASIELHDSAFSGGVSVALG
ncbi:MAG TPA: DUF4352 domain-containing protein [Dermatophilaceae bacterium]|nr:DUF4352 domain-containing protein [Dermatophilaceae bacterium]